MTKDKQLDVYGR